MNIIIVLIKLLIFLKNTDAINFVSVPKTNYGLKLDKQLQRYVNKLFYALKIKKDFEESGNVRLLLRTYYSLKKVPEYNWKIYEEIRNMVYVTESRLDEFYDLIKDVFHDDDLFANQNTSITNETYATIPPTNDTLLIVTPILTKNNDHYNSIINPNIDLSSKIKINDIIIKTANKSNIVVVEDTAFKYNRKSMKHYELKVWNAEPTNTLDNYNVSGTNRRIFEGIKSKISDYPFAASVHIDGEFACTSSIISKELVITAASCLYQVYLKKQNKQTKIGIRIGSDYSHKLGELVPAIVVYFHPFYDPITLKNNLAIIKMKKHLRATRDMNIRRILFDRSPELLPGNIQMVVLGWGNVISDYNERNQQLAATRLSLYSLAECIDLFSEQYVTKKHFCAGSPVRAGSGACMGDIGGPAVVSDVLVGVVSFGPPECGTPAVPTVFTKIGHYSHWIEHTIEKATSTGIARKSVSEPIQHKMPPVTPQTSHSTASSGYFHKKFNKYDEDILILQEILKNLALANHGTLDEIIYGELAKDFNDEIAISKYDIRKPTMNRNEGKKYETKIQSKHNKDIAESDKPERDIIEEKHIKSYKYGMTVKPPTISDKIDYSNKIVKLQKLNRIMKMAYTRQLNPETGKKLKNKVNKSPRTTMVNLNIRTTQKTTTRDERKGFIEDDTLDYYNDNKYLYDQLLNGIMTKKK